MYLKKSMAENVPNLKKETYSGTGSTEGPKQDASKETYTKTYYNQNILPSKFMSQNRSDKEFFRSAKTKRIQQY